MKDLGSTRQVRDRGKSANRICLICSGIPRPSSRKEEGQGQPIESADILQRLAKLFKVSGSIYLAKNLDSLPTPLLCTVCDERVRAMNELQEAIGKMGEELQREIEAVQEDIILNYQVDKQTLKGANDSLGLRLIRKTFAQCWTSCVVRLKDDKCGKHVSSRKKSGIAETAALCVGMPEKVPEDEIKDQKETDYVDENDYVELSSDEKDPRDPSWSSESNSRYGKNSPEIAKNKRGSVRNTPHTATVTGEGNIPPKECLKEANVPLKTENSATRDIYKCGICGIVLEDKYRWKLHNRIHRPTVSLQCGICGKAFLNRDLLRRHSRRHELGPRKDNVCEVCGKSYKNNSSLLIHRYTHRESPTFQCEVCGKGFLRPDCWRKHQLSHTGGLLCTICGKLYNTPQVLRDHMRRIHTKSSKANSTTSINTGTNTSGCDSSVDRNVTICGDGNPTKTLSNVPERSESSTEEAERRCPICNRIISKHINYERHVEFHSKNRDFHCSKCPASYRSKSQLAVHVHFKHKNHSDRESKQCEVCNRKFNRLKCLTNHKAKMHGIVPEPKENKRKFRNQQSRKQTTNCKECGKVFQSEEAFIDHIIQLHQADGMDDDNQRENTKNSNGNVPIEAESFETPQSSESPSTFPIESVHRDESNVEYIENNDIIASTTAEFNRILNAVIAEGELDQPTTSNETIDFTSLDLQFDSTVNADVTAELTYPVDETVSAGENSEEDNFFPVEMPKDSRQCPFCKLLLTKRVNYDQHVLLHNGEKDFPCKNCPFRFPTVAQLINHNRLKHGAKGKKFCRICVRTIAGEDFKEHQRDQHGITNIDAVYDSEKNLLSFECRACNETFRKEAYMNSENQVQICCDHGSCGCKEMFKDLQEFMSHHKKVCTLLFWVNRPSFMSQRIETPVCKICGKSFGRQDILNAHMLINHKEKATPVVDNTKEEISQGAPSASVNNNLRLVPLYPFVCETCGKCFQQKNSWKDHVITHSNERPFICDICGKAFHTSKRLKEHLECHIDTFTFPCEICGKLFKSKHRVNSHVYSFHDKRRPPRSTKKILTV